MQVLSNTREKLILEIRFTFLAVTAWISAAGLTWGLYRKWGVLDDPSKWGIAGTALAFVAVTVFFLRPSVFEFDRASNQFRWIKPGLFKSHSGAVPLDDIRRVRVDSCNMDDGKGYRVLVEAGETSIPFQHGYTTSDPRHHRRIVDLIEDWLTRQSVSCLKGQEKLR